MGKKLLLLLVFIIVVLVLIAVFSSGPAEAPSPEAPFSETPTVQVPAPAQIIYTDSGFSPSPFNIERGETVTFVNESANPFWPASAMHPTHSVYSGTSLTEHCPDGTGSFDACAGIAPGESWSFTFVKPGTWRYHDHLNVSRTGTVVVE